MTQRHGLKLPSIAIEPSLGAVKEPKEPLKPPMGVRATAAT